MSHHTLRLLAAGLVATGVLLAGGSAAYAEPGSHHDLAITGSKITAKVGDDFAVATVTVKAGGATRYAIGTASAPGGGVEPHSTMCDTVENGVCWKNMTAEADTYTWKIRYHVSKAGTWLAPVYVRPIGYTDPDTTNNRTTVAISANTSGDWSITGDEVRGRVGETVTARVTVRRPVDEYFALVLKYDGTRVEYAGTCHERSRDGRQVQCMLLGDKAGPYSLRFKVLAEGVTRVSVDLMPTDSQPRNNVTTVVVKGAAADDGDSGGSPSASASAGSPEPERSPGSGAGEGGDLPLTGPPVALAAAGGVVLLAAGLLLLAVARRRKERWTSRQG